MNDVIRVTGMVISAMPMSENDRRVELLTAELGKISAFLRGGRKIAEAVVLGNTLLNAAARPQFIAYRIGPKPLAVRFAERLGAMAFGWTSHSRDSEAGRDAVIFEYYRPDVRFK